MYIIEFEKGVYSTKDKGDPSRTLIVTNAQSFSDVAAANKELRKILDEIKAWRTFPNAKVRWRDEVSGALANER
jgi:glutaredoxin-related protein